MATRPNRSIKPGLQRQRAENPRMATYYPSRATATPVRGATDTTPTRGNVRGAARGGGGSGS